MMNRRIPEMVRGNKKFCKEEIRRRWMNTTINVGFVMAAAWTLETISERPEYAWVGTMMIMAVIIVKKLIEKIRKETIAYN